MCNPKNLSAFFVCFPLILFDVMGRVLRRRNGTEKEHIVIIIIIIIIIIKNLVWVASTHTSRVQTTTPRLEQEGHFLSIFHRGSSHQSETEDWTFETYHYVYKTAL